MAGQPPTIDLTSASPSHDGIEDITPRVPTSMADTFRETASIARASPAPTTPPHLRQACQQAPPATADEEACPICLTAISYNGIGPTSRFRWPHCNHCFHTGCAAHMVVEQPRPPCPTCRQPWTNTSALLFSAQCRHHGVELPPRIQRVDTHNAALQPPVAPTHISPHCCPRLFLADPLHPEEPTAWQELNDNHMAWAPVHIQQSDRWGPEWACLRCNTVLRLDHPWLQNTPEQPHCTQHGLRTLRVDMRHNTRGWIWNHFQAGCPAQPIHTQPARAHMAPQQLRDPHSRPWTQRGPPDEHSCSHPAFSWFYVPLLLAATNRLEPQAAEAWHQTPAAGNPWRRLVEHLQQARPVPWQQLLHVLTTLQQLATHTGQTLAESEAALPNRLREAGACQPPGTLVHLP